MTEPEVASLGSTPVARPVVLPRWPAGSPAGVSMTFDVDAEAGAVGTALDLSRACDQLGQLSAGSFGTTRGLGRILEVLRRFDVKATFYVPGITVERHLEAIESIVAAGHELGHHGYTHRRLDLLDRDAQHDELVRGITAHERRFGRPRCFRAPGWELTTQTLELLAAEGFLSDSSLMGDDRPYELVLRNQSLLELPVHWSLDDWPYLGFDGHSGQLADPAVPLKTWLNEFASASEDGRHVTYTMHPEVVGRGYCIHVLGDLLAAFRDANAAFLTHSEVVARSSNRRTADGNQ